MKRAILGILFAGLLFSQVACQGMAAMVPGPAVIGELKSSKERSIAQAPQGDLARLVSGDNAFAFDLYRKLSGGSGNLFYSPHSISSALAMTYAGARGATAQQMAQVLHFDLPGEALHPAFNSLDLELSKRGSGAQGKDGKGFRLRSVNALWGQQGYPFQPPFLDTLAQNYGAGMRLVDFSASEDARKRINQWVSEQTEQRIKELIAKGVLDPSTRLVLTNAIYFNAAWAYPFDPNATRDGPFTLLDNSRVTVPMMRRTEAFPYAQGDGYQAVELPYDKNELSMLIIMPTAGQWSKFESTLDAARVDGIVKNLQSKRVLVTMPRFRIESSFQLAKELQAMGMRDAFVFGPADFSGMDGTRNLYIGDVIHKSFVDVTESGTEAAAATAVVMLAGAAMQQPAEMTIDHPFVFMIRDNATGAILFVGRVMNPAP